MEIGIIGGGAAGMTAAIEAARLGAKVTIFEHMPRIGKKLLLTGSGKCNISNIQMDTSHFHGSGISFIDDLFSKCPKEEVYNFLSYLGIVMKDRNGYLYPYSENAASVLDSFRFALRDLKVNILTEVNITKIESKNGIFKINFNESSLTFDRIILACGSKSYKNTGSDGSGYDLAKRFGHKIIKPLPALTSLNCKEDFYPSIAGIRTKAKISLFSKDVVNSIYEEVGELQINKTGISGIPVFNSSFRVAQLLEKKELPFMVIDFLPDYSEEDLKNILINRIENFPNRNIEELMTGILNKNLCLLLLRLCGFKMDNIIKSLNDKDILKLIKLIKSFKTNISSTGNFESSQVTCGGVDCDSISNCLQSKLINGLYFAGEILDVNGDCGGYNLHFAFMTGLIAARNCIK